MNAEQVWDHCAGAAKRLHKLREHVKKETGVELSFNELMLLDQMLKEQR